VGVTFMRHILLYGVIVVLAALGVAEGLGGGNPVGAQEPPAPLRIRWQITGQASARAEDGSRIVLMGNGTFTPGTRDDVAGGGTWTTQSRSGEVSGSGTYLVTELLNWQEAPTTSATDRAGLAALRVRYSNASEGILVVSCHLTGTPNSVFEGITASMGYVQYWNRDAESTLFTPIRE